MEKEQKENIQNENLAKEENEFLTGSIIDINGASYLRS